LLVILDGVGFVYIQFLGIGHLVESWIMNGTALIYFAFSNQ